MHLLVHAQLQAPVALVPCQTQVGEQVVVCAAHVVLLYSTQIVVSHYVFISHAHSQAPVLQLQLVLCKSGYVVLLDVSLR